MKILVLNGSPHKSGNTAALVAAFQKGAEAALAASLFHYKELEIREVKEYLRDRGIPVRL